MHHQLGYPKCHDRRRGDRLAVYLHFRGRQFAAEPLCLLSKVAGGFPHFRNNSSRGNGGAGEEVVYDYVLAKEGQHK